MASSETLSCFCSSAFSALTLSSVSMFFFFGTYLGTGDFSTILAIALMSLVWGTPHTNAHRLANATINCWQMSSSKLNSRGCGGRLGLLQKGLPSIVWSSGKALSRSRGAWLKYFSNFSLAKSTHLWKSVGRVSSIFVRTHGFKERTLGDRRMSRTFSVSMNCFQRRGLLTKCCSNASARAHWTQWLISCGKDLRVQNGTSLDSGSFC
mmetsp:Transcript_33024/g.92450  ORF Transcript_33024/g.92450 Transcript_33024/m.92450 type:complete len:208 (-) Transcript_33024:1878-2501(-)